MLQRGHGISLPSFWMAGVVFTDKDAPYQGMDGWNCSSATDIGLESPVAVENPTSCSSTRASINRQNGKNRLSGGDRKRYIQGVPRIDKSGEGVDKGEKSSLLCHVLSL